MAGHSKFKNIQHRKGAQDQKRAKLFTNLIKEIIVAAKSGASPDHNPRLRSAILAARMKNVPKDRIDKAINQAGDKNCQQNYQEIRYEGFAPGGISLIIEALTDNRNRTASYVRSNLAKYGGGLGETGSVSFQFEHLGIIYYSASVVDYDKLFEASMDVAIDLESKKDYIIVYTQNDKLGNAIDHLSELFGHPEDAFLGWKPHDKLQIVDAEKIEKLNKLLDCLEDSEDVKRVFGNCDLVNERLDP